MASQNNFPLVFEQLKNILRPYTEKLNLKADTSDTYYIDGPYSEKWKKQLFFGSAQIKKNYVSFYLMPVYMYPDLLEGISPELEKRMQGKSCFNFKKVEPDLFKELAELTRKSARKFQQENGQMSGQDIMFDVNGQPSKGYLAIPAQPNVPGVIVLHAWWGLNQFFKNLCDRLASEGFVAFAPDLNNGKVAKTVDEAKQLMSEVEFEQKQAIVTALVDFMHSRPEIQKGPLASIGFSMGAAWSLVLASQRPEDIGKVVLFYGVDSVEFSKLKAKIIGHYSDVDEWEPLDGIQAMEADMRAAGLNPTLYIYPNKSHWFFEEDRPEYDPEAAQLAWTRTLEFLLS